MRFRPTPPAIPAELLGRFGDPEHVFGPNLRFRVVAAVCGVILLVMGVTFFLLGLAGVPLSDWVSGILAVPLVALGAMVLIGTRLVPLHWVFICPRGLLRRRGGTWDSVGWAEVKRFEDATLGHKGVTVRQCRIVTTGGAEWGFLADQTAEYGRLAGVLRRKVDEWRTPADPGGPSGGD
jgi:hypothetical protein